MNFNARPKAVLYARTAAQVSAAVSCAAAWDVQVSAAGGRHSYQGASVPEGYLVVDLSNMTQASRPQRILAVAWRCRSGSSLRDGDPTAQRVASPVVWT